MMSAKAKHCFDQYQKNFTLAIELEEKLDDDGGWSCVVRFYAALHLINAYLIDKTNLRFDPLSSEHQHRKAALERCPELRDAPHKYRLIKELSESVRYDATFPFTAEERENAARWLAKIVAVVEPKLKRA